MRTGIMALWLLRRWMTASVPPCSLRLFVRPASEASSKRKIRRRRRPDVIMDETVTVLGISQRWRVLLASSWFSLNLLTGTVYVSVRCICSVLLAGLPCIRNIPSGIVSTLKGIFLCDKEVSCPYLI
uniref:Secreted protein n=1 Tax=Ixodes ricinus TaxID=34613 RepID=A0A6B0UQT4_IXORI